jgi:hypothetical protein
VVRYRIGEDRTVTFEVGDYEPRAALVIDPVLAYSTYLGGSSAEEAAAIAVDAAGQAYVVGHSSSADFPTTAGALQPNYAGVRDAVVSKLSPLGDSLLYSTFIGGSNDDAGLAVAIDAAGNAYIAGQTASSNFPTTAGAFQTTHQGGENDGFVLKLSALGNALLYSTYLGGSANDNCGNNSIAIDSAGNAYVTGFTESSNFPTTLGAFQTAKAGQADAFVSKLNPLGTSLIYSTFIGGAARDYGVSLGLDSSGSATIAGVTKSVNFPTQSAFQSAFGGGSTDGFVAKLNPLGSALVYSTYLGGSAEDNGVGIALDPAGNAYAVFETYSTDLTTVSPFQPSNAGQLDAFIAKINPLGGRVYATYLGGSRDDDGVAIAVDAAGDAHVTGTTFSTDFPTLDAFQATRAGVQDVFVTKFAPTGSALFFSTYLGGDLQELGNTIAVSATADIYIAGYTRSTDFPVTLGAFQTTFGGIQDGFAAKIGLLPSTASCEVTMNEGGWITAANGDMATFNGIVQTDPQGNPSGHESYNDHGPVQPMAVNSVSILAVTCSDDRTTASIFGTATIDGVGNHAFRIDMLDGAQSGADDRYGMSLDNGYNSGLQPLGGGNIVIH